MSRFRISAGVILALASGTLLSACGGGGEPTDSAAASPPAATAVTAASPEAASADASVDVAALEKELQGLGCFACHAVDQQRVGPSYRDIAEKYRGQDGAADGLTVKILAGGGGVWGPVPMIAHPHLTQEQVKPLVAKILLIE